MLSTKRLADGWTAQIHNVNVVLFLQKNLPLLVLIAAELFSLRFASSLLAQF